MSYENLATVPVYKKALELAEMSRHVASYVSFNKDVLKLYKSSGLRDVIANSLLIDTSLITKKIEQAEFSKSYSERIKSASFINVMIHNINSYCTGLEKDGVKEKEYILLLRNEVVSFKSTFKKWKRSLHNTDLDF